MRAAFACHDQWVDVLAMACGWCRDSGIDGASHDLDLLIEEIYVQLLAEAHLLLRYFHLDLLQREKQVFVPLCICHHAVVIVGLLLLGLL